jgi:lipopolysaccharide/colanic/teichoic acid biosynthesis glycosyltransferase
MDIVLAVLGIFLAFPLLVVAVIAVKLDSTGPLMYTQARLGKAGRVFQMLKLRTMFYNAEQGQSLWASKDDWRVTRVGRFLRRFHIDEVPQLWNVLKGDMTMVGPRPERPDLTAKFNQNVPGFIDRLQVDQGITGWAQVNGGYDLPPAEKLDFDLEYMKRRSIRFDIYILFRTVRVILTGKGAR